MATEPRNAHELRGQALRGCPYAEPGTYPQLNLERHRWLHEDGQKLIMSWFQRAWERRADEGATFESFIFAWISVNAWASCVTEQDQDREYMRRLKADMELRVRFQQLLDGDANFQREADTFTRLLPIFRAQQLRRAGVRSPEGMDRPQLVQHYFHAGMTGYEPACAEWHFQQGEAIPADWPHVIAAIYKVRCNLFHGEKSAHSEMDGRIVRSAFMTLTGFFRGSDIL